MSERKENLLRSASKEAFQFVGNGVYLKHIEPKRKSAYEIYYENHPDEKKLGFEKEIPLKVIYEIIKSFKVEPKEYEEDFQRQAIAGLMTLNRQSKTARKLIMQLYHGQEIYVKKMSDARGLVRKSEDKIYLDRYHLLYNDYKDLALTILHETGHLIENDVLIPLGFSNKIYCDQYGKSIQDQSKTFSTQDVFKCERLVEAEKFVLTEQVWAECCSFSDVLFTSLWCWFKKGVSYSTLVNAILLLGPFEIDYKKERKEAQALRAMANKIKRARFWMKEALKSPRSLFSKQGRLELEEKAFNQAVAHRIRELILPQKEEKDLGKKTRKRTSLKEIFFDVITGNEMMLMYSLFILGINGVLMNCWQDYEGLLLKITNINGFEAKKTLEMGRWLSFVSLYGAGCLFAKNVIKKALNIGNHFLKEVRDGWCEDYNEQARNNSKRLSLLRQSNKKGMDLFVEAFCHKYQNALKPEDIKNSRTDSGEFEKENQKKRLITSLKIGTQYDLMELGVIAWFCNEMVSKDKIDSEKFQDKFLFEARKIYLDQKKKVPFQKVMEDYLVQQIKEGDLFKEVEKNMSLKMLKNIQTPSIKKALCARVLRYFQKDFREYRALLFSTQRDYLKLLINQKNVKERS